MTNKGDRVTIDGIQYTVEALEADGLIRLKSGSGTTRFVTQKQYDTASGSSATPSGAPTPKVTPTAAAGNVEGDPDYTTVMIPDLDEKEKPNEFKELLKSQLRSLGANPDAFLRIKIRINDLFLGTSTRAQQQPIYASLFVDGSFEAYIQEANRVEERSRFELDHRAWVTDIRTKAEERLGRPLRDAERTYVSYIQAQLRANIEDTWKSFMGWRDKMVKKPTYEGESLPDTSTTQFLKKSERALVLKVIPEDQQDDILAQMTMDASGESAGALLVIATKQARWRADAQAVVQRKINQVENQRSKSGLTDEQRDAYFQTWQDIIDNSDKIADDYVKTGGPGGISVQEFVTGEAGSILRDRFAGTAYAGAVNPKDFTGSIGALTAAFKAERDANKKAEAEQAEKVEAEIKQAEKVEAEVGTLLTKRIAEYEKIANDENEDPVTREEAKEEGKRLRMTKDSYQQAYAKRPDQTQGPEDFFNQAFGEPYKRIKGQVRLNTERREAAEATGQAASRTAYQGFLGTGLDLGDERRTTIGSSLRGFDVSKIFGTTAGGTAAKVKSSELKGAFGTNLSPQLQVSAGYGLAEYEQDIQDKLGRQRESLYNQLTQKHGFDPNAADVSREQAQAFATDYATHYANTETNFRSIFKPPSSTLMTNPEIEAARLANAEEEKARKMPKIIVRQG